tara:strand:- start:166 stop:894 length:729 start_codon:yes stop_codon:yes gene_type:complete
MSNEDIKKKFGLIVEDEWINKWGSEIFPGLEFTKHEDKYNKVDSWVKHLKSGKTKSMQLKVIVPMRKSRSITILEKQWKGYINDGVDLLYHISPIEYPNEFGKEDVRIELRYIDIQKVKTTISDTKLGRRVGITLKQMKKKELSLEFQMWIDDLYDKMMRPTEYGYYTKKKFNLKDASPTKDLVVKKNFKSEYKKDTPLMLEWYDNLKGTSTCSTTHVSRWYRSDMAEWKKEFPYNQWKSWI